jgi:hypothetical protein
MRRAYGRRSVAHQSMRVTKERPRTTVATDLGAVQESMGSMVGSVKQALANRESLQLSTRASMEGALAELQVGALLWRPTTSRFQPRPNARGSSAVVTGREPGACGASADGSVSGPLDCRSFAGAAIPLRQKCWQLAAASTGTRHACALTRMHAACPPITSIRPTTSAVPRASSPPPLALCRRTGDRARLSGTCGLGFRAA